MLQHKYIAIEGPIGVGKTSLAEILAKKLSARLVMEGAVDNPFIHTFYKDIKAHAFQTQLFSCSPVISNSRNWPKAIFFKEASSATMSSRRTGCSPTWFWMTTN